MRLAAVSLFGLVVGLVWAASALGECDRSDCGAFWEALYATSVVGFGILFVSFCGLAGAVILGFVRRLDGAQDSKPRAAWAPALAATSICLLAAIALALMSGGDWWALAAALAVAVGLAVYALASRRARHRPAA